MTRRLYSGWPVMVMHNGETVRDGRGDSVHVSMNCLDAFTCVLIMLDRITNAPRQAPGRPVPKPGGRPPTGADGTTCKWDQREGCWCWWQSDGSRYQPPTAAERQKLCRQRKKDEQRLPAYAVAYEDEDLVAHSWPGALAQRRGVRSHRRPSRDYRLQRCNWVPWADKLRG